MHRILIISCLFFSLINHSSLAAGSGGSADESGPSEGQRSCSKYKAQIKRLSDNLMNLELTTPFTMLDGRTNLKTLGELQKQHAKYMAELVLLNSMREINQGSLDVIAKSESINIFNNLSSDEQMAMLPDNDTFVTAMNSYGRRARQIATHQIVDNALTDLSEIGTDFIRNTSNAPEAVDGIVQRACNNNPQGSICRISKDDLEQNRGMLRGLLSNYVTTVKNSSEQDPSITPQELAAILNENIEDDFLKKYNDHYADFSDTVNLLSPVLECGDDQQACTTAKRGFLNSYNEFIDQEDTLLAQYASAMINTDNVNQHLKKYIDLAKVASRNAEDRNHRGFETEEEMKKILQRALSRAFPNQCRDERDGCLDKFTINQDGTIQMRGDLNFTFSRTNVESRISRLQTELGHINNAIEETKKGGRFKDLNGIIDYLADPLSYRRFCGRENIPSVESTCGYDGNRALNKVGGLIKVGNEILAHTYNNTPYVQLEQLIGFCADQREIYKDRSQDAFDNDWGATCSLADRNRKLRDDALPNQTITAGGVFDPRTGQRYDIEYPSSWQNYLNGAVAGFVPKVGTLVGTYYQGRYLDLHLSHTESYWIYPPADYYYQYNGLFSTSWSPVGGINGLNGYMF